MAALVEEHLTEAAQRGVLILNAVVLAGSRRASHASRRCETHCRRWPCSKRSRLKPHSWQDTPMPPTTSRRARQAVLPDFLIGAHAAVTRRPLLTRHPRCVATYIPGAELISPS